MFMKTYYIIIEKVPGDQKSEEHFDYVCETETQAWNYARDKSRACGSIARVKSVTEREERNPL
jgi:hypothetical protein